MAFKAPRIIRQKLSYLSALSGSDDSAKDHEGTRPWKDFQPLFKMTKANKAAFAEVDVRGIVCEGASAAHSYFQENTEAWRTNPVLVALGTMDEKGGAVDSAKELMALARQGRRGIAAAMLKHLPDSADRGEIEDAIGKATSGVGLLFQDDALETYAALSKASPKARLVDVSGGEQLHEIIWGIACFFMAGNFYSETVVKTLEHGLHGTQRRTQACATRLGSASHRAQPYVMTNDDFKAASIRLGTNLARRKNEKEGIEEQLQPVKLDQLLQMEDEGEEDEQFAEDDEEDEGDGESGDASGADEGVAEGRSPGWPMHPTVRLSISLLTRRPLTSASLAIESERLAIESRLKGIDRLDPQGATRGRHHRVLLGDQGWQAWGLSCAGDGGQEHHRQDSMAARKG